MTIRILAPLLLMAPILASCVEREAEQTPGGGGRGTPKPAPVKIEPPITAADVRNMTLPLPDIDTILRLTGRGPIILADTIFSDTSAAVTVTALPSLLASSAPLPNGSRRAVLPVLVETGGSGVFVHAIAMLRDASGLRMTGETFLGDRIRIERTEVAGDTARLTLIVHADGEERCCPTRRVLRRYHLGGGAPTLAGVDSLGVVEPMPRDSVAKDTAVNVEKPARRRRRRR